MIPKKVNPFLTGKGIQIHTFFPHMIMYFIFLNDLEMPGKVQASNFLEDVHWSFFFFFFLFYPGRLSRSSIYKYSSPWIKVRFWYFLWQQSTKKILGRIVQGIRSSSQVQEWIEFVFPQMRNNMFNVVLCNRPKKFLLSG